MGHGLNGDSKISSFIQEGFVKLFTTNSTISYRANWNPPPPFWKCALKDADKRGLECPVSEDEIRAAL